MSMRLAHWAKHSIYRKKKKHCQDCGCNGCFKRAMRELQPNRKTKAPQEYFKYISSPYWLKRKQEYYKKNKRICQACGSMNDIDLHHLVYNNFGLERDDQLACLCRNCHQELHHKIGSSNNMEKQTTKFIKSKQHNIKRLMKRLKDIDSIF